MREYWRRQSDEVINSNIHAKVIIAFVNGEEIQGRLRNVVDPERPYYWRHYHEPAFQINYEYRVWGIND